MKIYRLVLKSKNFEENFEVSLNDRSEIEGYLNNFKDDYKKPYDVAVHEIIESKLVYSDRVKME